MLSRGLYPRCLSALFGPTCHWSSSTWISQVWNPPWSSRSPLCVKYVLVITDYFTRYSLALVTKDQTAKTIARVLYKRFIVVFGVPAKILSDRGANFTSTLVEELCTAFSIQKCRAMAYPAQCNGQVECFHQTLFCMIGKLMSDKKAHWEQHLPELVQAYNSTWSVVTSYLLHYLMFGRCSHLPIDFYFLIMGTHVCTRCVPTSVVEVREHFKEAYMEAHSRTNNETEWQKQYYDRATSTVQLILGDIVLMKLDAFQGKCKVKDRWTETEYVVVCQVTEDVPMYKV